MQKNDICVLTAYFGTFPHYFCLWLKTCERNSQIDFFVFSDATYKDRLPDNVKIIPMTLARMKQLACKHMQMEVSLERPYKCCDYKPLYGTIFKEYICGYEYWGHCDIDLMFGDIYSFLVKNDYRKYDKFLPLGHLCFYRNTEKVNAYYKLPGSKNGDYNEVFTTDASFWFDELGGIQQIYMTNNLPNFTKRLFADISHRHRRFTLSTQCSLSEKDKNYRHQVFFWEDGKVYRTYIQHGHMFSEEYMYIHFKKRPNFEVNFDVDKVNSFFITSKGFIPKGNAVVDKSVMQRYNPYFGFVIETCERLFWFVSEKMYNIALRLREGK